MASNRLLRTRKRCDANGVVAGALLVTKQRVKEGVDDVAVRYLVRQKHQTFNEVMDFIHSLQSRVPRVRADQIRRSWQNVKLRQRIQRVEFFVELQKLPISAVNETRVGLELTLDSHHIVIHFLGLVLLVAIDHFQVGDLAVRLFGEFLGHKRKQELVVVVTSEPRNR